MANLLTEADIRTALDNLPGWERIGNEITRTFECETFPAAIEFVGRVGAAAESANHHPDIDIRWRKVTFTLATHSAGGLTAQDMQLAQQISELA